ncbi:MAG: DUF192 domain-containing protein [Selenomonadaceae bacterium]|nr:DUF192 domain-containing protein [Selenomonadaceae bacterium]
MIKNFEIETSDGLKKLQIEIAETFFSRLRGLMGRKKLPQGHGLLLSPCSSVHMLFMKFSIDVVYVDKNFVVKKIVKNLPAWSGVSICLGAESAFEFSAGESDRLNLKIGDKFIFPSK